MHLHSLIQDLVAHMLQTAWSLSRPCPCQPCLACLAPSSRWGETTTTTMSTQGHQVTPPYHAGRVGGYNGLTMSQVPGPEISAHLARSIWPCAICIYILNLTPSVSLSTTPHSYFTPGLPASHSRVSSLCSPFVGTRARTCNPGSRARPRACTGDRSRRLFWVVCVLALPRWFG